MNMYIDMLPRRFALVAVLIFISPPLSALDVEQLSWTETKEKWGQVLFCQRIYMMPEVKSRLYDFDVEHCNQAGQLMADAVMRYPEQERVSLKNQSERHAALLSRNTSEPYHSVAACRAYCRELAEARDTNNE